MKTYLEILAEDRRIAILQLLVEVNGSANESVLYRALEDLGHRQVTQENLRADLRFLETAGAIRLEWFMERIAVAHLLTRGREIREGKIVVDGIKRPSIGE